jgi:hypothetical protein
MKAFCLPIGSSEGHFKCSLFFLHIATKAERFREVSLNLSLKRAFSKIYIYFLIRHLQFYNGNALFLSFLHTPIVSTISLPLLKTSPFRSSCTIPGALEERYSHL